ncbi:hypothetical protein [Nonomuraea dietziae]|uniref:hypothetical protein n=1 Tax=Nonomuraea dietziae TaxID=65515 RepID=UPI0033C9308E
MPKPAFDPDDYVNPDAPEEERLLRPDHPRVRDMSYDANRLRQGLDLYKQSIQIAVMQPWDDRDPEVDNPGETLELYIKERPRGPGYVCDFLYRAPDLPVTVYGTLINQDRGLMVNELELWRGGPFTR